MAEITPDQDHASDTTQSQSTLVTLKELSAIAVALRIWHCEMNKYRTNDELEKFNLEKLQVLLKAPNPDLPTAIDTMIRKYASAFALSVDKWLKEHHKRVLSFHYGHENYILEDFDDFVCDYDGAIDYAKTAERMMRSDRLGKIKKFKIACAYFLEDHVRRVWPSVCKKISLHCINFRDFPELYYWICCLRNELNKIPINGGAGNNTVDEEMLDHCMPYNRLSVEYFWNRIPYRNQIGKAVRLHKREMVSFIKFILLPKFDDHQLDEFVNNENFDLMHTLLKHECLNERLIGKTWMRIRNIINGQTFTKLVVNMFEFYKDKLRLRAMDKSQLSENWVYLCREIWCSAPHGLRRSTIENISSNSWRAIIRNFPSESLLTVLTCATTEERSLFWSKCWPNLIKFKNANQLQQIMEICFENFDAIIQYKENVMASSEHLQDLCRWLLRKPDFDKLNDIVNFCFSNEDATRLFKLQSLESNFLRSDPVLQESHFGQVTQFNKFINDTYNDTTLAIKFKNHLLSLPVIRCFTPKWWGLCNKSTGSEQLAEFVEFIETFASTERNLKRIKMLVIDHWKENGFIVKYACLSGFSYEWSRSLDQFLLWCLGSDEEVGKFKQAYVQRWCLGSDARYFTISRAGFPDVEVFLFWCLGSDDEVKNFKRTYFISFASSRGLTIDIEYYEQFGLIELT
ncbi:uncharacterized protein LOC135848253 isoform X2 [Planococcus citri]|uniref:uncharacterized protein LOC135848253 isoform X2 n=1 Tax=Planococcus citri TaxID=170843 RepID=UPI0031F8E46C